ncbi:Thiamine biosynthesis protein ThiS [Planctomycetales bacterium 10988]|nr:Thiamine biosynthesis protein ThiS [Planctomycetales bacterium 10988]
MITIIYNGAERTITAETNLAEYLASLNLARPGVAVEYNGTVIPRSGLAECVLRDGDRLEVVTLVGGG